MNNLSKRYHFFSLIKFTMPSVIMMVIFSLYTIIDGMFIARFVGDAALAATNIVYPLINIILGTAIMFATGGSAIIAKTMGEGDFKLANRQFSFLILFSVLIGILIAIFGIMFFHEIIFSLGATQSLYSYCADYGKIMVIGAPVMILKMLFDYFFVTAGKPKLGFYNSLLGGFSNIILDYVFIVTFDMGISGAALATIIGYILPAITGALYFANKQNLLSFSVPVYDLKIIAKACGNGYSEMITQLSVGITTFLFNMIMLKHLGENGVAAITIVLYAEFLLTAAYIGFSSGVAPLLSYNLGSRNVQQLKSLIKYSYAFIFLTSILSFCFSILIAADLIALFAGAEQTVYDITLHGFQLFSLSFLLSGSNIFTSALFTALSNGKISAIISFSRSLLFFIIGMILLPSFLGIDGVWLIVPFADFTALILSCYFIVKHRVFHGYIND